MLTEHDLNDLTEAVIGLLPAGVPSAASEPLIGEVEVALIVRRESTGAVQAIQNKLKELPLGDALHVTKRVRAMLCPVAPAFVEWCPVRGRVTA